MSATYLPTLISAEDLKRLQPSPDARLEPTSQLDAATIVQILSDERERLPQYSVERTCQPGEIIFQEGELGDAMYIIISGRAVVLKGPLQTPTILGYRVRGESLGEMALLENQPRSATVVALEPMQLQTITQENFVQLMMISPQISLALMKILSARVRESSINIYRLGQMVDDLQRDMSGLQAAQEALRLANAQLTAQLAEVQALEARLQELAMRDALTGLYNRRYLEETMKREMQRAARQGYPLSLIMLDIDHFKRLNDTYGHAAGDHVLRVLGALLQSKTRRDDVACRYGGEEFVIVLPGAEVEATRQRAEDLRQSFEALAISYEEHTLRGTISLGVVSYPIHCTQPEQLLQAADEALYAAKNSGRNQVCVSQC